MAEKHYHSCFIRSYSCTNADSFYNKDEILWAWALRVNIHIIDRNMKQIANGAAVLPMLPADDKLSLK